MSVLSSSFHCIRIFFFSISPSKQDDFSQVFPNINFNDENFYMTKINQTPSHIRNLVLKPWKHESHRRFWTSLVFTKKMVVFTKMPAAFCLSLRSRIFFLIIWWHFPFVILTEKSKKTSHFNVDGNNFTVWKNDNLRIFLSFIIYKKSK